MIKKLIIKSNEWYERLPKIKGDLFYLSLVFIPYFLLMFFLPLEGKWPIICGIIWVFLVALWRTIYVWIKDWERINNQNDKL